MKKEVVVRIKMDEESPLCIVRKAILEEDGTVRAKYGLSREGDWVEVPEAAKYPDECYLPVAFWGKGVVSNGKLPNIGLRLT